MAAPRWTWEGIRTKFSQFTDAIHASPYDFFLWIKRADFLRSIDYDDLAAGDFYKALLLADEAGDISGEYHRQALDAFYVNTGRPVSGKTPNEDSNGADGSEDDDEGEDEDVDEETELAIRRASLPSYIGLAQCLMNIGCLYDAYQFCQRGLTIDPHNSELLDLRARILPDQDKTSSLQQTIDELPKHGKARREIYPWNDYEPSRYTEESINSMNQRLSSVGPACEVRIVTLPLLSTNARYTRNEKDTKQKTVKQLGLFAKQDIQPGEVILREKSLLTVNNRLHDELCDACSAELPSDPGQSVACDECQTTVFCSQDCLAQAQASYHSAVCDNEDYEALYKDVDATEASNALYSLLLGRAICMAEAQEAHPLTLTETQYLWGDYVGGWSYSVTRNGHKDNDHANESKPRTVEQTSAAVQQARTLPWSFEYNLAGPLHLLTTLDMDIYACTDKYDLWILNTLFAKFRGVANARMNPQTGRPEVAAVHPLWCLANHSCSPNVTWEWGGEIRMWARDGAKGEVVRWGPEASEAAGTAEAGEASKTQEAHSVDQQQGDTAANNPAHPVSASSRGSLSPRAGGIRKDAEILNHYCDVQLGVADRRAWAAGALGGDCMCERCQWEEETLTAAAASAAAAAA